MLNLDIINMLLLLLADAYYWYIQGDTASWIPYLNTGFSILGIPWLSNLRVTVITLPHPLGKPRTSDTTKSQD